MEQKNQVSGDVIHKLVDLEHTIEMAIHVVFHQLVVQ